MIWLRSTGLESRGLSVSPVEGDAIELQLRNETDVEVVIEEVLSIFGLADSPKIVGRKGIGLHKVVRQLGGPGMGNPNPT